jgi:hypothetical protein
MQTDGRQRLQPAAHSPSEGGYPRSPHDQTSEKRSGKVKRTWARTTKKMTTLAAA